MMLDDEIVVFSVSQLREFDVICDRFERAWKAGGRPSIEEFLAGATEASRAELARQLLDVEIEQRLARDEIPQVAEYDDRFPTLAQWLERRLSHAVDTVAKLAGSDERGAELGDRDSAFGDATAYGSLLGRTFGKYVIVEKLGAGGMGEVFRAQHTMIQCERALKLLRPNLAGHPEALKRFLIEAQASVELTHPNIVTTYHVDQDVDETIYIVMELLDGDNLDQLVRRQGPLEFQRAATIIQQVASGLEFAHRRGTVHRDIKPHNIMWTTAEVAKILDLGLARILENDSHPGIEEATPETARFEALLTRYQSRLTNHQAMLGTLPYMSPEQAANARDADKQSDVYSLGCTFYFLLTGQHAFAGDSPKEILQKHLEADFIPVSEYRPDLPPPLMAILDRMLSVKRDHRYDSAGAVEQELISWLSGPQDPSVGQPTVTEAVDLDDVDSLRKALVSLSVVSEKDWQRAETTAREIRQRKVPSRLSATTLFNQGDRTSESVLILQQLQTLQGHYGDYGLSEFQVRHVLNGDLDLLRLPQHVLLDQVGRGWKGEVFKARDLDGDRIEVVRTFAPGLLQGLPGEGKRRISALLTAVERLAALDIRGLPRVYGAGSYENRLHGELAFVHSEFVDGETLADIVHGGRRPDGPPLDVAWCVGKIRDACRALARAHDAGFLHLDIHARSLKIDRADQVQLLDLGIAPLLTRRRHRTDTQRLARKARATSAKPTWSREAPAATTMVEPPPVGTAFVMPPEQWQNREHVSVATDIYNLGCTLFYSLAGEYPFTGTGALELMQKHLTEPPLRSAAARRIPSALHPILERALAKTPDARFRSAGQLAQALDESLRSLDLTNTPETRGWLGRLTKWMKR
jgi:serine/threonine protein kinase